MISNLQTSACKAHSYRLITMMRGRLLTMDMLAISLVRLILTCSFIEGER